jgi:hypothetical protein
MMHEVLVHDKKVLLNKLEELQKQYDELNKKVIN